MRYVYVCSAIRGIITENISRLKAYTDYILKNGKAPVLPFSHEKGCNSLVFICDELWVFGDYHTGEMVREINLAKSINIKVKFISDSEVNKIE